jgi:hypothetical protein
MRDRAKSARWGTNASARRRAPQFIQIGLVCKAERTHNFYPRWSGTIRILGAEKPTMRAPLICLASAAGLLSLDISATIANPYDDCILQHMGTAQNNAAVNAIERACISKTSVAVLQEETEMFEGETASVGRYNMGQGSLEYGLLVELRNTTKFNITEVIVTVRNTHTNKISEYPVDAFNSPLPPGAILSGLGDAALIQIIPSGKTRQFFVSITEGADKPADFGKHFSWGVVPSKGIPTN